LPIKPEFGKNRHTSYQQVVYPMIENKLDQVLRLIDEANSEDSNQEVFEGQSYPKELLYGMRMSEWLQRLCPEPSDALRIAARGQHIRRWEVPRESYPETREGYLKWRSYLYGFHAARVSELMERVGYEPEVIEKVGKILAKRGLKSDPDVQMIEDVACLVFLRHYFPEFVKTQDSEKLIGIVRKTWNKMSEQAREQALALEYPAAIGSLLAAALG
jgi:hypothetical protein